MQELIEALQIFLRYGNDPNPTCCEHDVLYVKGPEPERMTLVEVKRLDEIGFFWSQTDGWKSFRYGSS